MNRYTYNELAVGQSESFDVVITESMIKSFLDITADNNPLHTDEAYAKTMYSGKVVYGMLTASFLSTLAGVHLPGKYSLIQKTDVEFITPVFIGDTLTFTGKIVHKSDSFRIVELKVSATSNKGKKVLRGKMRVGVLK